MLRHAGGLFDPLGLSKNEKLFEEYKVKEIANGRLAMVSMLGTDAFSLDILGEKSWPWILIYLNQIYCIPGFYAQAKFTGSSPLDNLSSHLGEFDNSFLIYIYGI